MGEQAWSGGHRPPLHTILALVWYASLWMKVIVAADSATSAVGSGAVQQQSTYGSQTTSKVVVEGVVYCQSAYVLGSDSSTSARAQHEPLKDAKVKVECNNRGTKATEYGRTDAQGFFSVSLPNYDYETWGSNGCRAKLVSSSLASCNTPTNMNGGLVGTDLTFRDKSQNKVTLSAGPFAFKQSRAGASSQERKLVESSVTKSSSPDPIGSGLWYSPPPYDYHYKSPPYYESPPYHQDNRHHNSPSREGHHSEHEGDSHSGHQRSSDHMEHGEHGEQNRRSRNKDCPPEKESHHYKSPPHHSGYYYRSPPPPYYSEHHKSSSRHDSSPYYKSPPHSPYNNKDYPPPHYYYKSPPPPEYHNSPHHSSSYPKCSPPPEYGRSPRSDSNHHRESPPEYHHNSPYNHHTEYPPPHFQYKSPPPYDSYKSPPNQYFSPPYYQKSPASPYLKGEKTTP